MSKNTKIADLINYISVDESGNVVLSTGGQVATQSYVTTAVSNLVNSAPSTLDTLNELAAALGNDANFATTVTNSIATKLPLSGGTLTGPLSIGTGGVSGGNLLYVSSNINGIPRASGDQQLYGAFRIRGGDNTVLDFGVSSGNPWLQSTDLTNLGLYNNLLLNPRGGNVGIGTLSPSYKLEVIGNGYFDSNLFIGNGSELRLTTTGINIKPALVGGSWADMVFSTGSTERLRLSTSATFSTGVSINGSLTKITPNGVDGTYDNLIKYIYTGDVVDRPNRWNGIDSTVTAGAAGSNVLRFRVYQGASAQDQPPLTVMEMAGNGWVSMYNRLNIEYNGAILNLRNQSTGLNANYQLGNNLTSNGAGMALFGSGFTTTGQYRQSGAYIYSNQAGGVTVHAEGANSIFLATNNSTAIFIDSAQRVGIGISNQLGTSKLSLGTGIGPKFLVYDNGSSVFAGLGQDVAAGNSTDLFCHGVSNLGFLTFGRLGTNGSSYTEWARFDTSGNFNMNGGQIRQGGVGIVQIVPIGPNRWNIPYSGTINAQYAIGNTGIPSSARWLLADVFITANISDHQNFMLTRQNFGAQKNWVDTRGNNPDNEFGNLTQDDVTILTYNGESDGYSPNYGIWKSSVLIPSSGRNIWINNYGNSGSSGYILFIVRGYSL